MRVEEAIYRTVRITLAIGERMMLQMSCRPLDRVPLQSHRAKNKQEKLDHGVGYEAAMRKHTVIPHRDPNRDQHIHDRQEYQIRPIHRTFPEETYSESSRNERHDDYKQDNTLIEETSNISIHRQPDFLK